MSSNINPSAVIAVLLFACITMIVCPSVALAEPDRPIEELSVNASLQPEQELIIGLDGQTIFTFADACQRDDDVVGCATGLAVFGLELAGLYHRPNQRFAVGLAGSIGWQIDFSQEVESCSSGACLSGKDGFFLFRAAASGRFYILSRSRVDLWTSLEAGLVGATNYHIFYENDERTGRDTVTKLAPELGLAAGMDFRLVAGLHLGFKMGALLFLFDDKLEDNDGEADPYSFGKTIWPQTSFSIGYFFGL